MDFTTMSAEELSTMLTETRASLTTLFALDPATVTVAQVGETETLLATVRDIEAVQAERAAAAQDAADRFAAARATFSNEEVEASDEDEVEASVDIEVAEAEAEEDGEDEDDEAEEADSDEADATVTAAAHIANQPIAAARAVAKRVKRPAVKKASPVIITAAADIPNVQMGSTLEGMDAVGAALISRAKGLPSFNKKAAQIAHSQSGGQMVLSQKFGVASFEPQFESTLVASGSNEYAAVKAAIRGHNDVITASMFGQPGAPETLTAAGWCAPSENVYSYIADYVVDGLSKTPEVKAPRGGLNITTGPAKSSQGTALDDFGWTQTEAQAEAQDVKPCEVIVCPDFEDHRLDAVGYCYKIPLLTQKAYPEIITDALKYAGVLYAHRMNRRVIADKVALSDAKPFEGYGPSFTDTLEALSILAVKERRKWDIGVNATLTVEVPVWVQEVFRADMSRRAGLALDDVATDQKIAAHFAARKLNVEYVSDWQELTGTAIVTNTTFDVLVYPSGTFVKAIEDVINLSAVYDAASLSINEYTGVFFEQGYLLAKVGYSSSKVTIPVNTAGEAGALTLTGAGDATENGSF